ncbi:MAG: AmmeMemoRadiSam system radical SAM enzyme [Epulopiscium sp.]|nr:AmmeMemoRadiSam system radical SAM enzyme [Candidatus Epulonipiscium sp.]HOQ16612.1 AmmeMemoRadiSam system radical SAM enzyme [Defluviitaleaceae bacterium]HPT76360.1 AmmeMemoRadiSam system radical SAM enzyme [Defluviitaleaceae bacterium]
MKVEACFYEKHRDKIHCFLCPHHCLIENHEWGKCKVRIHEDGVLYSINYGEITAAALDPIEKKPLHYYKPGTFILSVGSFGCNLTCSFCQNYSISQYKAQSTYIAKEKLALTSINMENNIGLAFTYNEPTIWYEYVYDTAKYLKENFPFYVIVLITNGYIEEEALKKLLPYVDAMNIDLKSFNEQYYKELCGGRLKPVLKSIELAAKSCHLEITTLLVSKENDNLTEIENIAKFISSIDSNIPLHLTRYFPNYKLNHPATDKEILYKSLEIARKYLSYVNLGNI